MGQRPFKIAEIGYLHILLAGYLVSVLCIKADLHYTLLLKQLECTVFVLCIKISSTQDTSRHCNLLTLS
jgi:hypothetical protein